MKFTGKKMQKIMKFSRIFGPKGQLNKICSMVPVIKTVRV